MKTTAYRLERVLNVRRVDLDRAAAEFARATSELFSARRELDALGLSKAKLAALLEANQEVGARMAAFMQRHADD